MLGKILADNSDKTDPASMSEITCGKRDISSGSAEHARHAAMRSFDSVIRDGSNDNERHCLIVDRKMEGVPVFSLVYHGPELIGLCVVLFLQSIGTFWILRGPAADASPRVRRVAVYVFAGSVVLECVAFLFRFYRVASHFPRGLAIWGGDVVGNYVLSYLGDNSPPMTSLDITRAGVSATGVWLR